MGNGRVITFIYLIRCWLNRKNKILVCYTISISLLVCNTIHIFKHIMQILKVVIEMFSNKQHCKIIRFIIHIPKNDSRLWVYYKHIGMLWLIFVDDFYWSDLWLVIGQFDRFYALTKPIPFLIIVQPCDALIDVQV